MRRLLLIAGLVVLSTAGTCCSFPYLLVEGQVYEMQAKKWTDKGFIVVDSLDRLLPLPPRLEAIEGAEVIVGARDRDETWGQATADAEGRFFIDEEMVGDDARARLTVRRDGYREVVTDFKFTPGRRSVAVIVMVTDESRLP